MAMINNSVVIHCPPEEVFDYLSDLRSELEWNPLCKSMDKLTDGPVGVGTRFQATWSTQPPVVVEVVQYDRPRRWVMHTGGPVEINFTARVDPAPEGAKLSIDFEAIAHGWFKLVFPVFLFVMRRQERLNMVRVRDALERRIAGRAPRVSAAR